MKHRRPSHNDLPLWITESRDYAPPEKKRSGLFDVLGNVIGAFCVLGGIVMFVAVCHFTSDSAVIEIVRGWGS